MGVFAVALAAILGVSAWHLEVYGVARTREDRVAHAAGRMRGVEAEAIVLSDSVTAGPAYFPKPAPGVYPMLTNGYLRLTGQYLLFRRFLQHNRTRRMFLFVHPAEFISDIPDAAGDGLGRYTYVDSVFTRPGEKRILDEAGAHPKRRIDPRFELLLKTWYPNHQPKPFSLGLFTVDPSTDPIRRDPVARVPTPLTAQARYTLERFQADCRAHHVKCTIVNAPTPPGVPRFDMVELGRRFPGLEFVDVHDFVHYDAHSFVDGMHLDRATGKRYVRVIQAHIAPLFAPNESRWDGARVDFSRPEALSVLAADTYYDPEPWGIWSCEPGLSMRFRLSRELHSGVFRVALRVVPKPGSPSVPVSFWLDGQKVAETLSMDAQTHEVRFAAGKALLPDTPHTLELRMPYTVNLRASGVSADARDLGPGVSWIELGEQEVRPAASTLPQGRGAMGPVTGRTRPG